MSKPTTKIVEFLVAAEVTINDSEALQRITGMTVADEETFSFLGFQCLANGHEDGTTLYGYDRRLADAFQMRRVISPTEYELFAISDPENSRLARTP